MQERNVRISAEPIIDGLHRRIAEIVFAAYVALLTYVCFVPFDFTRSPQPSAASGSFWGLRVENASIQDIFANIAIYMPLGALCYWVLRRRNMGRLVSGSAAVLLGGTMSFLIENGQYFVASRVSSWADVVANTAGSGLGVIVIGVWHERFLRVFDKGRASAARNWWLAVAKAATCLLLLVHLRPYDVVVDLFHTTADLRHADVSPLAAWHGLEVKTKQEVQQGRRRGMHELPRARWDYALDRLVDVAAYAALAALLVLGLGSRLASRVRLYAWVGFVVTSLALLVTCVRIFLTSHGLDTAHFVCGLIGWFLGCLIAPSFGRGAPAVAATDGERVSRRGLPRELQWLAVASALVITCLYELVPFDFDTTIRVDSMFDRKYAYLPFGWHFLSRPNDAFYDISGELLRYATMGACIAWILRRNTRWPWRGRLAATMVMTGMISFAFEAVHLVMATRHADVTTLLLSIIASFAGCVALQWIEDYRSYLSVAVVDDPMTRQLTEGETYEPATPGRHGSTRSDTSRKPRAESHRPD